MSASSADSLADMLSEMAGKPEESGVAGAEPRRESADASAADEPAADVELFEADGDDHAAADALASADASAAMADQVGDQSTESPPVVASAMRPTGQPGVSRGRAAAKAAGQAYHAALGPLMLAVGGLLLLPAVVSLMYLAGYPVLMFVGRPESSAAPMAWMMLLIAAPMSLLLMAGGVAYSLLRTPGDQPGRSTRSRASR